MQQELIPLPPRQDVQQVVRVEKNLNSLGFFSPLIRGGGRQREKTISLTRILPNGVRTEARATIIATRTLPTTADLDKYLAFQLIVAEIRRKQGAVANPVGFTTYQLLKILGLKAVGKRYQEVAEWLKRMSGTQIESEGAVYFAKGKRYASANFHVFNTTVTAGEEFPDGRVADQNYVWLSEWQLENLNSNYVLPIDLEYYRKLTVPIAKAMVSLLYVWFYASTRPVQRRYRELCQFLNISPQRTISKARERLSPALDQLQEARYIESWEIAHTVDRSDFKVMVSAGPVFTAQRNGDVLPRGDDMGNRALPAIIGALGERGIDEKTARRLMLDMRDDCDVLETIEWIDTIVSRNRGKLVNPPGLYISLIKDGITPPPGFVSSRKRQEISRQDQVRDARLVQRTRIEREYRDYREKEVTAYLNALAADIRSTLLKRTRTRAKEQYPMMTAAQIDDIALKAAMREVEPEVNLATFDEFEAQQNNQLQLSPTP